MTSSRISRRQLLRSTGTAALGAAALGSLAGARPETTARANTPVGGPLGAVYGRFEQPRGIVLGHVDDSLTRRAVTWQTTGRTWDVGSPRNATTVVRYCALPEDLRGQSLREYLRSNATVVQGTRTLAPSGYFEDDPSSPQYETAVAVPGEHPSMIHRAVMDLPEGAPAYAYMVGGEADGAMRFSDVHVFRADRDDAWTFTHLGDHGTGSAAKRVAAEIAARSPDLHLLTGDIAYADGYQPGWDEWANVGAITHETVPLITTPGNHESKDYFGQAYRARFARPNTTAAPFDGPSGPVYNQNAFGWTHKNVCFVSGSGGAFLGDPDLARGATDLVYELVQIERLFAEAAVRRAAGEIDFLVYAQHFPLFTNEDDRGPISPQYTVALEHVLQRYQVDLVLVGHDHMYQRSVPTAFGLPTGLGPEAGGAGYTQVVAGSGGKSLYEFAMTDYTELPGQVLSGELSQDSVHVRGPWTATDHLQFCFSELQVEPGRIRVAGMVFEDFGDGIAEDPYVIPPDHPRGSESDEVTRGMEYDRDGRPVAWRAPSVGDEFVVARKADVLVAQAARAEVRSVGQIVGDLPEARGEFVFRERDDCTAHAH